MKLYPETLEYKGVTLANKSRRSQIFFICWPICLELNQLDELNVQKELLVLIYFISRDFVVKLVKPLWV